MRTALLVLAMALMPMVVGAQPVYEWNDEESTYTDLYRNIKKTEQKSVEEIDVFSINSLEQQIASIDSQITQLQQRKTDLNAEITAAKTAMGIE